MVDIAKRLGLAPSTVSRIERRMGLHARKAPHPPEVYAEIRRLRGEGWPFRAIRERLGVAMSAIVRALSSKA